MDWPIDTTKASFIASAEPQPVLDFESKRHKTDADGQLLWSVPVVALVNGNADVIKVKVAGEPRGIVAQSPIKLVGFTVGFYDMSGENGRHLAGQTYRAERVEPLVPARASTSAGAS